MNTDLSTDPVENQNKLPPKQGMTTKVVKGSFWTVIGQVLPLAASFIAAPFVIRFLGAEAYGVLVLAALIPSYLGFADFGMGIASTKFGSEAFAKGSHAEEARIIRTAGLIALIASVPPAAGLFFFSETIAAVFNVPEYLRAEAALALKFASITFVLNFLNGVFNTPQFTRLRMDLATLVTAGFRILGIALIPVVIYLGGGVSGAVFVIMIASFLTLCAHFAVSGVLLKELFAFSIERPALKPMSKFGGAYVIAGIAGILLGNLEKIVLPRLTSVKVLAYYSVAFTLATLATTLSAAMVQSLLPAFSQLHGSENRKQLHELYSRGIRLNVILLIPILVFFTVAAKPFLTVWAGEDFGRESVTPLYILLVGLAVHIVMCLPYIGILAAGRTDVLAKLYWAELVPYTFAVVFLISKFGINGAAIAWSLRAAIDSAILFYLGRRIGGLRYTGRGVYSFLPAIFVMVIPIALYAFLEEIGTPIIAVTPICLVLYCLLIWKITLQKEEITWLRKMLTRL